MGLFKKKPKFPRAKLAPPDKPPTPQEREQAGVDKAFVKLMANTDFDHRMHCPKCGSGQVVSARYADRRECQKCGKIF